jgi:hypothetical protein
MTTLLRTTRSLGALGALLLAACVMTGPSRIAQGQLYVAGGAGAYDGYFHDVHQQQVEAASWGEDKKSAHRALVQALSLTPDAPDVTIVQATHEAASRGAKAGSLRLDVDGTNAHVVASGGTSDGSLFRAIEDTSRAELERARKMHGIESRIATLAKSGTDLQGHVREDWAKRGAGKETEVENELRASLDVLSTLKARADREARESEDFVADLERALETASEDRFARHEKQRAHKGDKGDKGDKSDKPERKEPKASAEPRPADAPAAAPKPAPAKPADPGEVFTP